VTTTQLDRRREQSAGAEAAAEKARATVEELDRRLHTNDEMTRQQTQALRNAEAEAKRLKRSLKTQARDHARLVKARQKAAAKAAKTRSRAAALDEKYSKSVLADLIRREKEKDRASTAKGEPDQPATGAQATAARATAAKAAKSASARTSSAGRTTTARKAPDPATETAAGKTARRAR
jgi:hypothetical protein